MTISTKYQELGGDTVHGFSVQIVQTISTFDNSEYGEIIRELQKHLKDVTVIERERKMSRVEENQSFIDGLTKSAVEQGIGPFEEAVAWQMGAMNAVLCDISKSLAIIADKAESEVEK